MNKFLTYILLLCTAKFAEAKKSVKEETTCGACLAIMMEMQAAILAAAGEKVEMGIWRIKPDGTTSTTMKSLVRTELFLMETLEQAADNMTHYMKYEYKEQNLSAVIRTGKVGDLHVSVKGAQPESPVTKGIKHACDTILEEHEETIVDFFRRSEEVEDPKYDFCVKHTSYCTYDDVKNQKAAQQEAILIEAKDERDTAKKELQESVQELQDLAKDLTEDEKKELLNKDDPLEKYVNKVVQGEEEKDAPPVFSDDEL